LKIYKGVKKMSKPFPIPGKTLSKLAQVIALLSEVKDELPPGKGKLHAGDIHLVATQLQDFLERT
jgi:hypothetical protein